MEVDILISNNIFLIFLWLLKFQLFHIKDYLQLKVNHLMFVFGHNTLEVVQLQLNLILMYKQSINIITINIHQISLIIQYSIHLLLYNLLKTHQLK